MIHTLHDALHSWIGSNSAALRDHLMLSTALLLILLAIAALPSLHSRSRYVLILLGITKFLVPAVIVTAPAARLAPEVVSFSSFSMDVTLFAGVSAAPELFCILAAIWFAGTFLVTLRIVATHLDSHRIVLQATAASIREHETMAEVARQSTLRSVPRVARFSGGTPMTAGVLRPVVLIPAAPADRLSDDELKAVLAHELAHVERRDNLAAIVQNVATALFWFHPALWLANVRLQLEAEKDCDERVLDFVPDTQTYLSGILEASYGFIAPQPAGVSCMSTSQLKERMDNLMRHQKSQTRSIPHWLVTVAGVAAVVMTAFVSSAAPASTAAPGAIDEKANTTAPKLISRVEPVYPESARARRVEGLVILEATISDKGAVTGVAVAKGVEGDEGTALANAAMDAVRQWKFEPATKDGEPVQVVYTLTINFKLAECKPAK